MSAISGTRSSGFWFFLIPGLLLFTFIVLIPLVWNVFLSFTDYRGSDRPSSSASRTGPNSSSDAEVLGLVPQLDLDDRRHGDHPDAARPRARRPAVRRHRPQVRRPRRQLPARDLLPAADPPRRDRGDRDRLDPPPRERRAEHRAREHRPRRAGAELARRPRHRDALDHGRHGLGADRLPRRDLHGGAAAGRPRALRGRRTRRRRVVPALPLHHGVARSGPRSSW